MYAINLALHHFVKLGKKLTVHILHYIISVHLLSKHYLCIVLFIIIIILGRQHQLIVPREQDKQLQKNQ